MVQTLERIVEDDFSKGYNDRNKPEDLEKGYLGDLLNGFISENKIIKRSGYSIIGDTPVSKPILGQQRHEPEGGTKYILRASNDANDNNAVVESWSGSGNWSALSGASSQTASANHEFVMAENATYIFNGTDTVLKTTDGTSTTTVSAIPKGKGGKWFHNFLFVYGESSNPSRLRFSDVNAPETHDSSNGFIDVNPGDGEEIKALGVQNDELLIFKTNRVWSLTGYGTADFTLTDLGEKFTGIGTDAPRSVVEAGDDTYYLSFQGDVPHFRSIRRSFQGQLMDRGIISDPITGTMKRIVTTQIDQCAGVFDGRKVWWAICTSGSTNNEVVVFDTVQKAWSRLDGINANVFHLSTIGGEPEIYFGESGNNARSYKFDGSGSDNGSAIDFTVKTKAYSPQPGYKSRYKYLYLTADVESDVDVDVDYSPDGFTFTDLGTFALTGEGAAFGTATFDTSRFGATTTARDRIGFAGGNAYFMQYQFRNNTADEDVSVREWEVFYQNKRLRDA